MGALSDDAVRCLSDVCLSVTYVGPKPRTEKPRKTKIGTEVAHITNDSDTTFKVKRSNVKVIQVALLTAGLVRQTAAAVGVGTCWPWETAATLPSARRRKTLRCPRRRRGAGHIVACYTCKRCIWKIIENASF